MGGYIIVAGGETLPEGFQGVQASRAELIDCAKCAVIVCDGAEVPRVVRAAGVMINGDSAAVPSERVSGVQLITCGRGVKHGQRHLRRRRNSDPRAQPRRRNAVRRL